MLINAVCEFSNSFNQALRFHKTVLCLWETLKHQNLVKFMPAISFGHLDNHQISLIYQPYRRMSGRRNLRTPQICPQLSHQAILRHQLPAELVADPSGTR